MTQLDIIVVNYKVPLFVAQALQAVRAATKDINAKVWVVDNDSQDGSLAYLQARFPEVHYIKNRSNEGFSKANNLAIRASSAPYVLLLNPDTIIGESTLTDCLQVLYDNPRYGAVGAKLLNSRGEFLPECRRGAVTLWNTFCRLSGLAPRFPKSKLFNRYALGYIDEDTAIEPKILSGAFMLLRREALEKVGLLDERYFMYGEDIDLSYAIRKAGYKICYIPTPVLHYKGESESAAYNPTRYSKAFYGAMALFYAKYHPYRILSQKGVQLLTNHMVKRAERTPRKRLKKTISKGSDKRTIYPIDLKTNPVIPPAVEPGSYVIVQPSDGLYDRLLAILPTLRVLDLTLLTHYPHATTSGLQPNVPLCEEVILGPGGLYTTLR